MTKQTVESRASALLKQFQVESPPVPVEQLARDLGARLSFEPFDDDMSGMLYRDGERVIIGINSAHSQARQRFSIAHEIGHLLLHDGRPMFVDKAVRVNWRNADAALGEISEEIDANAFDASLLMPTPFLKSAITRIVRQRAGIDPETLIRELADRFRVSLQAMEYRLANAGIAAPR